jgi:hypothetical protein
MEKRRGSQPMSELMRDAVESYIERQELLGEDATFEKSLLKKVLLFDEN